jgi:hypothetical protein
MKKHIIFFSLTLLSSALTGFSQIQSFEFGYGVTNTLSVPMGKLIRIHSLIGTSQANWVSGNTSSGGNGYVSYANANASRVANGIAIRLASGREIKICPFSASLVSDSGFFGTATISSVSSISPNSPVLIPGPIEIQKSGDDTTLLVYEILDNLGSSSAAQSPSQGSSVVVPTSAAGDVDVKMEQSADNVTWTECLPGTYNSSTVKRFFRLRAVEK